MPNIQILPPAVADQIAAGEVVERPASVVKELLENSIDAGATSIEITVEKGGTALIRVSDDGCGMQEDDAVLSVARHATSKIRSAQDLVGVGSFGFRGEALAAIASVSHLELETASSDGAGVRVLIDNGERRSIEPVSRRRGTSVTVARLFNNAPARRRFLRSPRSEWRAIHDVIVLAAVARLDLRLVATHDGRKALELPPARSLADRLVGLWGPAMAERMTPVEDVEGAVHTSGLVEKPSDVGTATRRVQLLVNGRAVRDAGIVRAAEAAYRTTIPAGVRPSLFLNVVLPGRELDVNVHPAKAEVRFLDRWGVERAVESAVRRALGTFDSATFMGRGNWRPAAVLPAGGPRQDFREVVHLSGPAFGVDGGMGGSVQGEAGLEITSAAGARTDSEDTGGLVVPQLRQLRRTYMMFEQEDGVVLIDQHSAHERVLFERFTLAAESGVLPGQRLLFPLTLHLSSEESEAYERNSEGFARLGFEVEGFGGNTLIIRSVPMPHPRFDAEFCLRDTLSELSGDRNRSELTRHDRLFATLACKAAVKAGDQLSDVEMRALYLDLARCTLPAHDVHGRAVVLQIGWDELERRFGRR